MIDRLKLEEMPEWTALVAECMNNTELEEGSLMLDNFLRLLVLLDEVATKPKVSSQQQLELRKHIVDIARGHNQFGYATPVMRSFARVILDCNDRRMSTKLQQVLNSHIAIDKKEESSTVSAYALH